MPTKEGGLSLRVPVSVGRLNGLPRFARIIAVLGYSGRSDYKLIHALPYCILYFAKWICNTLIQLDDGAQSLESLFQLFCLFLWQALLQDLRQRFYEFLCLKNGLVDALGNVDGLRTSISVRLGTNALTSRIILGLAPASNDSSWTLNTVFSLGFSCIAVQVLRIVRLIDRELTAAGSSEAAAAAGAAAAVGIAIS